MKPTIKAVVVAAGVFGSQIAMAAPSVADPVDDPCGLAVSLLCRFMPIAPDLDSDVDLTTELPAFDTTTPAPDLPAPADLCASGCN